MNMVVYLSVDGSYKSVCYLNASVRPVASLPTADNSENGIATSFAIGKYRSMTVNNVQITQGQIETSVVQPEPTPDGEKYGTYDTLRADIARMKEERRIWC